ncbi:MAG: 3-dehydroquinate synthase [Candidatus Omnitrophota bacterium]
MRIIKVNLQKRSYDIAVGSGITGGHLGRYLSRLNLGSDAYVITNALVKRRYAKTLQVPLKQAGFNVKFKLIPDTEKSKSIETLSLVLRGLAGYDRKKRIFIIAFGGGVVGDLAGFVASIYKRGVPLVQIPTTLLAQVDSAIGGKSAIDLSEGKNLVGAFYQPRLVFSDIKYLHSLKERELRCGVSEVIKYALIKDAGLFSYLEGGLKDILGLRPAALEHIVQRCSRIKAAIVSCDEKEEKGLRTILNFGHTAGHAIEAAGGYVKYSHGEAIALGMLAASIISREMGFIDASLYERIKSLIKSFRLPTSIERAPLKRIIAACYRDKKFIGSRSRLVLLEGIGRARVVEDVPFTIIKQALQQLQK